MLNCIAFSTFTILCNDHHYLVPERFYHPKRKLIKQSHTIPSFSHPPSSSQLAICVLSLCICLLWYFICHFKVYNWSGFKDISKCCVPSPLISKTFSSPQKKILYTHLHSPCTHTPSSQPLVTTNLLSVSMDIHFVDSPQKRFV